LSLWLWADAVHGENLDNQGNCRPGLLAAG